MYIGEFILSIPKSFYVSMRLMGFWKALKLPIFVRYNCRLLNLSGICIGGGKTGALRIGFGKVGIIDPKYQRSILEVEGILRCDDSRINVINRGSRISICKNAELNLGAGFHNSAAISIICEEKISIGKNVTTSWDTLIMDTDFHDTVNTNTNQTYKHTHPIVIGDNVWIGCRCVILKGSEIAEGCIIGANSLVSGKFNEPNIVIAGNPAKSKKQNITKA